MMPGIIRRITRRTQEVLHDAHKLDGLFGQSLPPADIPG